MSEVDKIIENCLGDGLPPCQVACPAGVRPREYIALISQGKFKEALDVVRETLPFTLVCGRACEHLCEAQCNRKETDEPIAIRALKRFIADWAMHNGGEAPELLQPTREERVAIIGAGPSGLTCALRLLEKGYHVTIFEASSKPGGMITNCIPNYRIPEKIASYDIGRILAHGLELRTNIKVGRDIKLEELRDENDACFIGIGAQQSARLGVRGDDLEGVFGGLMFLMEAKSRGRVDGLGEKVAIIGGGNVAIDSARTALRLGAKEVTIFYRRTEAEMPANPYEIGDALEEGVKIEFLVAPTRVFNKDGKLSLGNTRMRLGSPDESGRPSPVPIEGSEFRVDVDTIIAATGQRANLTGFDELEKTARGTLKVDKTTLETNIPGIFAGGDIVRGPSSIVEAIADGNEAATSIDRFLDQVDLKEGREKEVKIIPLLKKEVERKARVELRKKEPGERTKGFDEVEFGLSEEEARKEAERCLSCECKLCVKECEFLKRTCEYPKELAEKFSLVYFREQPQIPYSCNLCNLCEEVCPQDLNMGKMCLELRQQLVEEGLGPLPAHKKFVEKEQEWVSSDSFTLSLPDLAGGECKRIFFPGCNLAGYSPSLVLKTYDYLREKLPGTGIILGCCGAPTHEIGEEAKFREMLSHLESRMRQLGASEIILPCPDCYHTLKHYMPQFQLKSLYEVMVEVGLPQVVRNRDWRFSLHDSCKARWESSFQDSVRTLILEMGYEIEEMAHSRDKTLCCGSGGMTLLADFNLTKTVTKRRAEEASSDILTYCAACRETLALEKPTIYILDLIFNPDWERDRLKPPTKALNKRENQCLLKSELARGKLRK